ncbi:proton-conducting transporter transmembrane domain-containing protein [Kaistia algarum]|uniref:proton-conducting transporter transmembrane domain-containing protein n=1 Tax=Kaistia algarum TaxID=2083279 RepID=UPI001402024E|nr:proton-conducting transporter membrane subunit [Kaistia algarum]MCX5512169.1 proton-conducting transporter membrane subunit [Kaistia algarum]
MTNALASLSPAYPLFAGALAILLLRGLLQDLAFSVAPLAALALVWLIPLGSGPSLEWLGLGLHPVASDWIARLFGTAFAIAAFFAAIYALDRRSTSERAAALLYAGAAQGVVFAGDLLTLFVYWEVMAIGSTLVVLGGGAERAGLRYAWMHVFGGVLFFAGLTIVASAPEGLALRSLRADSFGTWLLLAGILVNAGAPPVSAWVVDAYPRASWAGAVFLSAFTTKAAVAVLIRLFPGEPVLVAVGLFMAVYGLVYALIENDIRRMLSYSIVGQVGFMVVAVGIGSPLALAAAATHAFAHILYKSLLMMAAGSVLRATGTCRLTELGGLASRMPATAAAAVVGGLSLAAAPLTAGFVSKSAIMASLTDAHAALPWFVLTAVSAGSFLYAGLKLPWFAFFHGAAPAKLERLPRSMIVAMIALSVMSLAAGIVPGLLAGLAPEIASVSVLTPDHVVFQLQLLGASIVCFILLMKLLWPVVRVTMDFDWLWRELPTSAYRWASLGMTRVNAWIQPELAAFRSQWGGFLPVWSVRLLEAGNWRTGDIALAATALLAIALLIAAF